MQGLIKLFGESLDVLLIPRSGREIISFRLRRGVLTSAACTVLVTAIVLGVSIRVFVESQARGLLLASVRGENRALRAELGDISATIDLLRTSVEQNAEHERRAWALAGEPDPIGPLPSLGMGGPTEESPVTAGSVNVKLRHELSEVGVEVDNLVRRSETQRRGFENVIHLLRERKEELVHVPSIHPVGGAGWYSSGHGYRVDPFTGRRAMHHGLDISCPEGTAVLCTADGVVRESGNDGFFGLVIKVDHGNGIETVYAHNAENLVRRGDRVRRGQVIARVGNSGRSTGPHVHYAVVVDGRHLNPMDFILPEDVVVD
jgi:murein DD-endopeptidase MepM/ murein hydrolase activator NlpD